MRTLELALRGHTSPYAHEIIEAFGGVCFKTILEMASHRLIITSLSFEVKRFRNWYTSSAGDKPLYVLIPSVVLVAVWVERLESYAAIKYATASPPNHVGHEGFSAVFLQHRSGIGLYICLDPRGAFLRDAFSLGV
ncbi:MAG: hypothetical protein Q7S96_01075 [bacterium]|nr:hypothetical protein [bacterium]